MDYNECESIMCCDVWIEVSRYGNVVDFLKNVFNFLVFLLLEFYEFFLKVVK